MVWREVKLNLSFRSDVRCDLVQTKVMTVLRREGSRCIMERNLSPTEGKALVASLLAAVAGCWRDTVPQALAALGLSPSEYNSCLLNNTQV